MTHISPILTPLFQSVPKICGSHHTVCPPSWVSAGLPRPSLCCRHQPRSAACSAPPGLTATQWGVTWCTEPCSTASVSWLWAEPLRALGAPGRWPPALRQHVPPTLLRGARGARHRIGTPYASISPTLTLQFQCFPPRYVASHKNHIFLTTVLYFSLDKISNKYSPRYHFCGA